MKPRKSDVRNAGAAKYEIGIQSRGLFESRQGGQKFRSAGYEKNRLKLTIEATVILTITALGVKVLSYGWTRQVQRQRQRTNAFAANKMPPSEFGNNIMCINPGFSSIKPLIEQPGVAIFQRRFPQNPGKFCMPINNREPLIIEILISHQPSG